MCVYSMVFDHFKDKYPSPQTWTFPIWEDYNELKRKAELYDEMTKQKDCEKPEVAEFERLVKEFLEWKRNNES